MLFSNSKGRSGQAAATSPKPCKMFNIGLLCRIFPHLIRWRLLVFYAPYYIGSKFEPEFLERHGHKIDLSMPTALERERKVLDDTASRYAVVKARRMADAILAGVQTDLDRAGLQRLCEGYAQNKRSAMRVMKKVNKFLEISMSQLQLALYMYVSYIESASPSYDDIDVYSMAETGRWSDLAYIAWCDLHMTSAWGVFADDKRDRWDEDITFRRAVSRCLTRYFTRAVNVTQPCGPSCDHKSHDAYRIRRSSDGKYSYVDYRGRVSSHCAEVAHLGYRFCERLRHLLISGHQMCPGTAVAYYRLSNRQQALNDGSLPVPKIRSPPEIPARHSRAEGIEARRDIIEKLDCIDEVGEDQEEMVAAFQGF